MRCIHCGSEQTEYIRLKSGSYYSEIVHLPNCILLAKKGEKDGAGANKNIRKEKPVGQNSK